MKRDQRGKEGAADKGPFLRIRIPCTMCSHGGGRRRLKTASGGRSRRPAGTVRGPYRVFVMVFQLGWVDLGLRCSA